MEAIRAENDAEAQRRWVGRVLRAAVSLLAFGYLASTVDLATVARTLTRLPSLHLLAAETSVVCALGIGAFRHRALLGAYGAIDRPSLAACLRLYWVGFFYNTFLPGSVGGDVIRAVGARTAFGSDGATASFAVVLVERVLGLFGLVIVASTAFALRPLAGVEGVEFFAVLGLLGALIGVGLVASGRRVAPIVPGFVGAQLAKLPAITKPSDFFSAFLASIASHVSVALTGHALISGLDPGVTLATSAVVVPVGAAAAYFPLSISGLGVREAAFARLYELASVPGDAATAFALAFLGVQLVAALVGGLLSWFGKHPV